MVTVCHRLSTAEEKGGPIMSLWAGLFVWIVSKISHEPPNKFHSRLKPITFWSQPDSVVCLPQPIYLGVNKNESYFTDFELDFGVASDPPHVVWVLTNCARSV